ncbi:L-noviosyl transferase [Streptomyces sp. MBT84]|uniref:nucleotide disphospho-sugar-binding domain-containing protein n=1 Tax=Streptomyces sp. MBT84 TaxID=1488414 RepID=UPI001C6E9BD6|nr:nucleotide disphospho-sugar-binding domain-containing protein [Streptomyces sp. MBT84]MBW8699691.1 L-noviosyl transferase [Streptomyces sp. MBT84]
MRVLVISTPVPTHFLPLVPLLWALRAAGHEVTVLGQPDVLGAVRAGGLTGIRIGESFDVNAMLLKGLPEDRRPLQERPRPAPELIGGYGRLWGAHAASLLDRYADVAEEYRPELILADPLEYCSLIIGARLGVPVVHHRWTVDAISGPARRFVHPELQELCDRLGLPGLPDPAVLLDPCPPSLRIPDGEPGVPVRFVPYSGGGEVPAWVRADRGPGAGRRRVAVSLGNTLALHGERFTRDLLHTLAARPGTEIVVTLPEPYRTAIGPLPDGVTAVDPLPLHLFLGTCDAMVHHGGAGTAMTATAFGLPQLALPQLADHFPLGDRLVATGAGRSFDTAAQQDDPRIVGEALDDLLSDPRYAASARGLAAEMAAMPPPSAVAADLADLARAAGRPREASTQCTSRN